MIALRNKYSSLIVDLAKEAVITGAPINRPIWWIDPMDKDALSIDSGKMRLLILTLEFIFHRYSFNPIIINYS